MTSRERVMNALNFKAADRVPKDLGAMGSTGISCFAYPKLVRELGLPQRPPRVFDTGQMLAVPDIDVLDALGCDVVCVNDNNVSSAFSEPERWKPFDFGGRLEALVADPSKFEVLKDGTVMRDGNAAMVPNSYVFDIPHAGEEIDMTGDIQKFDLAAFKESFAKDGFNDAKIGSLRDYCKRARESSDRAVMFRTGFIPALGLRGGMARFSILCMTEPEHIHELHELIAKTAVARIERLMPAIAPYADVLMLSADDQGTQNGTILPPNVFRELFVPYYKMMMDAVHKAAPGMKVFLHSCGAIYDILDDIADAGFDVLNPIQWSAGKNSYSEWKDKCRGQLAMWGGGVNTQTTLPLGSAEAVVKEVSKVVPCLAKDSGYVFCAIHNILAEIEPEKIAGMYRAAAKVGA